MLTIKEAFPQDLVDIYQVYSPDDDISLINTNHKDYKASSYECLDSKNELMILEYKNIRVLTTQQLSDEYGVEARRISENYNRNCERYIPEKHFYRLEGQDKRDFLNHTQIADSSMNAKYIYLWTERGALLHAKSLNTDEAWEKYDFLIETYFRVKAMSEIVKNSPPVSATTTGKLDRLKIMELNALTQQAKLLYQMSNVKTLPTEQKNILVLKAAELLLGAPVLPSVGPEQMTLTL